MASFEELLAIVADAESEIQALTQQRQEIRKKALELNAKRDAAKQELDLAKLRDNYPNLKIEPA